MSPAKTIFVRRFNRSSACSTAPIPLKSVPTRMVAPGLLNDAVVHCGLRASVQSLELFELTNSFLGGFFFILAIRGSGFNFVLNCTSRVRQRMANTSLLIVRVYFETCVESRRKIT